MTTKPECMIALVYVTGPRPTPLVPVVVTRVTHRTPAEPPLTATSRRHLSALGLRNGCG